MLKKIIQVKGTGTFNNYQTAGDVTLLKLNVLHAINGQGKTTLTAICRSQAKNIVAKVLGRKRLGAGNVPEISILHSNGTANFKNGTWSNPFTSIEIFDQEFINDNVYSDFFVGTEQKRNLLDFALGETAVKILHEINDLDEQNRYLNTEISSQASNVLRHSGGAITIEDFLELKDENDLEKKIVSQEKIVSKFSQVDAIKSTSLPKTIALFNLDYTALQAMAELSYTDLTESAVTEVNNHIEQHLERERGEGWLRYGTEHIKNDECPFCKQSVVDVPFVNTLNNYFNKQYKEYLKKLSDYNDSIYVLFAPVELSRILLILKENEHLVKYWSTHVEILGLEEITAQEVSDLFQEAHECHKAIMETKLANPLSSLPITRRFTECVAKYDTLKSKIEQVNAKIMDINKNIQAVKDGVQLGNLIFENNKLTRLRNIKSRQTEAVDKQCKLYEELLAKKAKCETDKKSKKDDLAAYNDTLTSDFADKINDYLLKFGASFKIAINKPKYTGGKGSLEYTLEINGYAVPLGDYKTSDDIASFKNTLSNGDKSTLAFAFFLAKMDSDNSITNKVIIFDDPISSQDHHRKDFTRDCLVALSEKAAQVIVLSHDLGFAFKFFEKKKNAGDIKYLKMAIVGGDVTITKWDIAFDYRSEYVRHYFILDDFVDSGRGDETIVANTIRVIMEANLRHRFPKDFRENEWLGEYVEQIKNAKPGDNIFVLQSNLNEIESIKDYAKKYHHPTSNFEPINSVELKAFANRALNFITQ